MHWILAEKGKEFRKFHVVWLESGQYSCTCPQFIFRKEECKHIKHVKGTGWLENYEIVFE